MKFPTPTRTYNLANSSKGKNQADAIGIKQLGKLSGPKGKL